MRDLWGLLQKIGLSPPWPNRAIFGVSENSEKVQKDWIFVALSGQKEDGREKIPEVLAKGAACVIVRKGEEQGPRCLGVEDPRKALGLLCGGFYGPTGNLPKIVAVTGTAGKSSTAHLVWQLLRLSGKKAALSGSVFCFDGKKTIAASRTTPLPEALWPFVTAAKNHGCEYWVMEASSQALCQERLAGLSPDVGVFTNFGQDHLDYHQTLSAYLAAKCRLLKLAKTMAFGVDSPVVAELCRQYSGGKRSFAVERKADFRAEDLNITRNTTFHLQIFGQQVGKIRLPLFGDFSVQNALGALAAMDLLGLNPRQAAENLPKVSPLVGRMETLYAGEFTVIQDYAHTPESLSAALKNLKRQTSGRLILVFGCGGERDRTKRPKMAEAAAETADMIFLTTDNPRWEDPGQIFSDLLPTLRRAAPNFQVEAQRPTAICKALDFARKGDTVLLAGKGHETTQIVGKAVLPMDEKEITLAYLKQKGR